MSPTRTLIVCAAVSLLATPHASGTTPTPSPVALLERHGALAAPTPRPSRTGAASVGKNPRASRAQMARVPLVWRRLAWCESRWHLRATSISGKHHGLWQIHAGWFRSTGVDWRTAGVLQQYRVAQHVYRQQGARAWSCARQAGLR